MRFDALFDEFAGGAGYRAVALECPEKIWQFHKEVIVSANTVRIDFEGESLWIHCVTVRPVSGAAGGSPR
jgi:hypothetical protein